MIRTSEIEHLFKKDSDTIIESQKWDDMFNEDNTNAIRNQKERSIKYDDVFKGNHSNLVDDHISMAAEHNERFNSDNTNEVRDRILREQKFRDQQSGIVSLDNKKRESDSLFSKTGTVGNTLKHQIKENALSSVFFSSENVELLHSMIRYQVWLRSGKKHIIDKQSNTQLEIIMRSVYLQYAKNLDCNLRQQIDELNDIILEYAVKTILSEISMYISYLDRINTLPTPMEHPKNLSTKGDKSLELQPFL